MSRIPIRLRLTLAFAVAMAAVLAATGAFLYFRLQSSLDEALDESLQALATQAAADVERGDPIADTPLAVDERSIRVVAPDGRVLEETPQALDGPARILERPVDGPNGHVTVVVSGSLGDRNETLSGFRPVEAMRAEADAVSGADPGRRLPLPRARDEIRRLGETLNAMLGRLEAAIERERSFVADASHELRTPIALLKTELELALRHPRSQAELEQSLRSAADETDRLVRLAEDLLVLARSDQGRLALRDETVVASALLDNVAGRFGGIDVSAADGLELVGDEARLAQALGNLVDNAIRHGGAPVLLSARAANGAVELHVLDEGPGFPPGFLPHAFERFSRPDEARAGQGAGLGLALAQAIAVAHGGSAGAANRAARGADVWLSIPKPSDPGSPGSPR